MRDYGKVSPRFWIDGNGKKRKTPEIKGRLKCGKIKLHNDLRSFVIARDGYKCVRCGAENNLIANHIVSRKNGGSHHPDNLQCLCQSCNATKANLEDKKYA